MHDVKIEPLHHPASDDDLRALAELIVDAVDSGAAVSFLAPLEPRRAEDWWRGALASAHPKAVFLVARDAQGIVGTVQLQPAWAPNQPHRADVGKLLVHRRGRGAGIGTLLMLQLEEEARREGFRLLTLDAKRGAAAIELYRRLDWIEVGIIPDYALDADGVALHDTVVFYKKLSAAEAEHA